MSGLFSSLTRQFQRGFGRFHQRLLQWTRPTSRSLLGGTLTDLARTRSELLAENALLRQQLIILRRQVKRPASTKTDQILLVLLAQTVGNWKQALFIVQPDTLLGARVARGTGIKLLRTPYHAPRANACCERFLGSVRRECLDHLLISREQQLFRILQAYISYFKQARPHQGLHQQIPDPPAARPADAKDGPILAVPILGGLHHDYHRAA